MKVYITLKPRDKWNDISSSTEAGIKDIKHLEEQQHAEIELGSDWINCFLIQATENLCIKVESIWTDFFPSPYNFSTELWQCVVI